MHLNVVRANPGSLRYEIYVDEVLAGFLTYQLQGNSILLNHTEVFPEFGGKGIAEELVMHVLKEAKSKNFDVLPYCPYVPKVIKRHNAEFLTLVPEGRREEFGL
ncbi:MAG: GNAT family N-acetyltransferase [Actinomycetes bacterium]